MTKSKKKFFTNSCLAECPICHHCKLSTPTDSWIYFTVYMTSLLKNLELYTSVTAGETLLLAKTKSLTLSHDEARAFLSSKHQWTLSGRVKERDMVKWICLSKPVFPLSWAVYCGHKQNTKWSFNFYSLDLCEVFWLVGVFLVLFVCLFLITSITIRLRREEY